MYRNAAHILSVCKDLYHWPERIKVGDNQIISQKVTIRNKSKGVIHMTAIATTMPRKWRNVYLTRNEWDKLRPAIKSATISYSASGCFEGIYLEVYVNETEANQIENDLETL